MNQPLKPVTLTKAAMERAELFWQEKEEWADLPVRLYLCGKGCDGFEYGVTFDVPQDDDHEFLQDGSPISVIVDQETLDYVRGATITWVDDERGQGFVVANPNHRRFRGKFYKNRKFMERFNRERQSPIKMPSLGERPS